MCVLSRELLRGEGMLCSHEDLSMDPQHLWKSQVQWWPLLPQHCGSRDRLISGTQQPANLAQMGISASVRGYVLKIRSKVTEEL